MSQLWQPLGLGLRLAPSEGTQWDVSADFDANFEAGRFAYLGQAYPDEPAWRTAIGATASGLARTFLAKARSGAAELFVNGDGASAAGWTTFVASGTTLVSTAGELVLTPPGATSTGADGFGQVLNTEVGKAYLIRASYRRGTTVNYLLETRISPQVLGNLGSAVATTDTNASTSPTISQAAGAAEAGQMGAGGRISGTAGASSGTSIWDDLSVKEAVPYQGFTPGGLAAIIKGMLPASHGSAKVVFQTDDDSANLRNYVRVVYGTDQHLRVIVRFANTEVANLHLGAFGDGDPFELIFSCAPNEFRAALIGGPVQVDTTGDFPGVGTLRIGRSRAGESWDGAIHRVRVLPALSEAEFLARAADSGSIVAWGDSLTASAGASSAAAKYPAVAEVAFDPDRSVVNQGIGGQTSTQIAARQGGQPLTVTVSGNSIPASGGVAVTAKNINVLFNSGVFTGTIKGKLAGIGGTMSTDASGNWTFTRATAGSATDCPAGSRFVPDLAVQLRSRTNWLWLGRNGSDVGFNYAADIAACVAYLGHERYLVGSLLTSASDDASGLATIQDRNAALAATYGARYVDVFGALRTANDGSANDLADIAAGYTPRSLRSDAIHLNDAGYAIVAATFKAAHDAMGW